MAVCFSPKRTAPLTSGAGKSLRYAMEIDAGISVFNEKSIHCIMFIFGRHSICNCRTALCAHDGVPKTGKVSKFTTARQKTAPCVTCDKRKAKVAGRAILTRQHRQRFLHGRACAFQLGRYAPTPFGSNVMRFQPVANSLSGKETEA